MSRKELLKPRYKVIADYPGSKSIVGDILIEDRGGWFNDRNGGLIIGIDKYPHLFKPLQWWEDRKMEDMPKFVRCIRGNKINRCYLVADPSQNDRIWHKENEIEFIHLQRHANFYTPITEAEYLDYLTQQNKKA